MSETQSGVISKVKAAPTTEQAHASLGMSFNTTPATGTETDTGTPASQQESPMSYFCKHVQYDITGQEEEGKADEQHQDIHLNGECRRFAKTDLTTEV